jgi:hypothetical protein
MTTTAPDTKTRADAIRELAAQCHVAVTASRGGEVVTVAARFPAGDALAYYHAEQACRDVLGEFRQVRPGTVWGTDSGSVGGAIGLREGRCELHMSGVEKRLARQFLGASATLTLAYDRARDRAALIGERAVELRDAVAALGDDYLTHLADSAVELAADLDNAERYDAPEAAQLRRDLRRLTARIGRLVELA